MRPVHALAGSMLVLSLACGLGGSPDAPAPAPAGSTVAEPATPAADPMDALPADMILQSTHSVTARRAAPADVQDEAIPGRYVMKLKRQGMGKVGADGRLATGNAAVDAALGKAGMKKARAVHRRGKGAGKGGDNGLFAVDADADETSFRELMKNDDVEWVEPVRKWKVSGYSDPYYTYQWNMAQLDLERVHSRTQGQGVIVAVVDSGVTAGADGPMFVLPGWDFQDDDADASDTAAPTQSPTGSHGTHVAGTIAQSSNNGVGVTGLAPMASILPVRVGDYSGVSSENIAEGVVWAVDNGAQVINISIGGNSPSKVVEDAVLYAYTHGVVVVAASGNEGYDDKVSYPAAYPTVIAVGAHDASYRETIYSNHGKELALLAPGGDTTRDANRDRKPDGILQGTITSKGWGYAMLEGTSMASPHVAGAAALLVSVGVKGPDAVRAALIGGSKENSGNRILDVNGALDYAGVGAGTVAPAASGTEPVATAPATGTAPATSAPTPGEGRPARGEGRASAGGGKAGKAGGKGEGKAGGKKRPH